MIRNCCDIFDFVLVMERLLIKSRQGDSLNCVNTFLHWLTAMKRLLVCIVPMVTIEQDF